MNAQEYAEKFLPVLEELEQSGKVDIMRGIFLGLLFGADPDERLRLELLLALTYLTAQQKIEEDKTFKKLAGFMRIKQEEGTWISEQLKELLKKEPENGTTH